MLNWKDGSMIDPIYQYKIFADKKLNPHFNMDFPGLTEYLIIKHNPRFLSASYAGGTIVSILLLILFFYLLWNQHILGIGSFLASILAFMAGLGMSREKAKLRHITYFIVLLLFSKWFSFTPYPIYFWGAIWLVQFISFKIAINVIFSYLRENENVFLDCVDENLFAIFFSEEQTDQIEKLEDFKKRENIDEIPQDPLWKEKIMGIGVKPVRD